MATFRFALDPLLRLRRREEDRLSRELGGLEAERRRIEDLLRQRQEAIAAGKTTLRESLTGRLDVDRLRQQATATLAVDRMARRAVVELAAHAQIVERARAALIEAARRRRAIELLRERAFAEWRAGLDRRERDFLDELATISAARTRIEAARMGADVGGEP